MSSIVYNSPKNQSVSEGLARFLDQEGRHGLDTLTLTVNGTLQRNPTYRSEIKENDKRRHDFRESLRRQLCSKVEEYQTQRIGEERHLANIEMLSSELSERHGDILRDGTFRIGSAQKALNLYLKYCWARGIIEEPPHCPIDRIVLDEIKWRGTPWTRICTIKEYEDIIEKAKEKANGKSLACWELEVWETATSKR